LLGRHVCDPPLEDARLGLQRRVDRLRDAEIEGLGLAVERHEHVERAHVAMNDAERLSVEAAELVRVVQADERLRDDPELGAHGEPGRSREVLDDAVEGAPVEVFHDHVVPLAVRPDLVGLHDVRVRQACGKTSLLEEHRDVHLVVGELRSELLDDEELVEAARTPRDGEVHVPHPAARELGDEVVLPDVRRDRGGNPGRRHHVLTSSTRHATAALPRFRALIGASMRLDEATAAARERQ